jgi:DNA-directed RNA polymerase specialized sigma24 family protein
VGRDERAELVLSVVRRMRWIPRWVRDDVTQETWSRLEAAVERGVVAVQSISEALVLRIAQNSHMDVIRRERAHSRACACASELSTHTGPSGHAQVEARIVLDRMRRMQLSRTDRQLLGAVARGLDSARMSALLRVPRGTVRRRLHELRKRFETVA